MTYLLQRLHSIGDKREWHTEKTRDAPSRRASMASWYPKGRIPGHMRVRKEQSDG